MLCRTNLSTQPQCLYVCIFAGKFPPPLPGPCPPILNRHIMAEVNTWTVCPYAAFSNATVHVALSTLPPETLNHFHESLHNSKEMPGEEQKHHNSGAPPALAPIPAAADQTSIHSVPFHRPNAGHTQQLQWHLTILQEAAGWINQRVAHGSCSLCLRQHSHDSDHCPLTHQDRIFPSAGIKTHQKNHPMSSLLQDNTQRQSLSQALQEGCCAEQEPTQHTVAGQSTHVLKV